MRAVEIGLVLRIEESWTDGATPHWAEIRELALRAEAIGFDTVWIRTSCSGARPTARRGAGGSASR